MASTRTRSLPRLAGWLSVAVDLVVVATGVLAAAVSAPTGGSHAVGGAVVSSRTRLAFAVRGVRGRRTQDAVSG